MRCFFYCSLDMIGSACPVNASRTLKAWDVSCKVKCLLGFGWQVRAIRLLVDHHEEVTAATIVPALQVQDIALRTEEDDRLMPCYMKATPLQ